MTFEIDRSGTYSTTAPPTAAGPQEKPRHNGRPLPQEVTGPLAELFKLMSDETRLQILFLLHRQGERNVRALCEQLHQSQPAVSHHLALLRAAGLIDMRREGKHNFYRVLPKRFEQLTAMVFAASPGDPERLRFKDYELTYSPIGQPC